jgi:phospholipase C
MDTRRDFLKKAILLSGTTGLSSVMPPSIQRALEIDPEKGSTFMDAEHVVILMQENRSFDHCFGTLRGVRGYDDPRAITLPDGNLVWLQPNKKGETYAPFRFNIKDTKATWMGSIPHSRPSQVDADNKGKYNGWLEAKRSGDKKYHDMPLTMGHYNRDDLPFNYAFADAFTICDQNFSSAMTCTWPNRLFFWTGSVRSEQNGNVRAVMNNTIPWGSAHWKTFPEHLEDAGISWKIYQNDISTGGGLTGDQRSWLSNFGCNPLEFFSQFNTRFYPRYVESLKNRQAELTPMIAELEKKFAGMKAGEKGYDKLKKEIAKKKEVLADVSAQIKQWSPENFEKLTPYQKNLYYKAFTTNAAEPDHMGLTTLKYEDNGVERELPIPKGDVLYQFRKDVDEGNLPAVSWLVPSQNFSDHPSAPWYGAWFTSEILDILTKDPEVWKKTIFILTYDENDGYFDHVPPFVAPDKSDPETGKCSAGINETGVEYIYRQQEIDEGISKGAARTGPVGLGFRVPMIIASPWTRGGRVCSEVFDHTSTLQFLEKLLSKKSGKSIRQDNISAWRRAICGDLTSAFNSGETEPEKKIHFLKKDPFIEKIYNAKFRKTPRDYKALSREEIAAINHDPLSSPLMVHQEPGMRPSCPLPYQLYADGGLTGDKKAFSLQMKAATEVFGSRAAGAPFKVYAPQGYVARGGKGYEADRTWDYAVTPGGELKDEWPLANFEGDHYLLRVYGPNGFFREFAAGKTDADFPVGCEYERSRLLKTRLTGNVEVRIPALAQAYTVEITDNAYGNAAVARKTGPAAQTVVLNLKKSHGWYDFTVRVKELPSFSRRYAGRVETGKDSYSDPAIGRKA